MRLAAWITIAMLTLTACAPAPPPPECAAPDGKQPIDGGIGWTGNAYDDCARE